MKVLQIIYSLSSGGAERFVVDLSNELAEQNIEVYLITVRDDNNSKYSFYKNDVSEKVKYINLKIQEGFRLSYIIKFYAIIKNINPDIIHCHQNLVNYIFPISIIHKSKFFYTVHSNPSKEISSKIEYWIRRYFFNQSKWNIITISNQTSKSFLSYYKSNRYYEIYNGRKKPSVSNDFFKTKNYFSELRNDGSIIFLHIGRCDSVKNQKMLINVFNNLIKDYKTIFLIIIGDGFSSQLGLELKQMANKNILFLGAKHNVQDYYSLADAFCLSSTNEGMPITLIEALAFECTPICTPVGGIIDTIENKVTGFLSNSISEEDYYNAIISFLKNRDKIKKETLHKNYLTRFSIEKCAQNHIYHYKSSPLNTYIK